LFDKEKERFIEAFHTVSSWPVKIRNLDKDISDSISSNIKSICSDFSSLKKVRVLSTLLHYFHYFLQNIFPSLAGITSKRRVI